MSSVVNIHDCYGCGLCAVVCPKQIVDINLNKDGFYEPFIKEMSACIDCSLCTKVCSFLSDKTALSNAKSHSYSAWSNDPVVRQRCSSGGIGFEIGRLLINSGYKVCVVRYNVTSHKAEHYIANTIEELIPSIGSKYIQSFTVDGFKSINRKEKYLVTGTPCQIDSFRRYIRTYKVEDNFVLLDFFCHGVPSMLLWDKYIKKIEATTGEITQVSWRDKHTGWHDSWVMSINGKQAESHSRLSQGDMFYKLFLGDQCLGKACYSNCKYKYKNSSADIRIGDLWGETYKNNEEGISALIVFTEKGEEIAGKLHCCTLVDHSFETVAEGQLKTSPKREWVRALILYSLRVFESFRIECILTRVMRIKRLLLLGICHPNVFYRKVNMKLR